MKPRFRKGQVVFGGGGYFCISEFRRREDGSFEYRDMWSWHSQVSIRPLTASECGPRPRRRK